MMKKYIVLIISIFLILSCGTKVDKKDFLVDNPVKGIIDGKEWKYESAVFSEAEFLGITDFSLDITSYIGDDLCGTDYLKLVTVKVNMPKLKKGKFTIDDLYDMDEVSDITIRHPDHRKGILDPGWSIDQGFIKIEKINKNSIEGYIEAYVDEEYNVKGNFKALRCDL